MERNGTSSGVIADEVTGLASRPRLQSALPGSSLLESVRSALIEDRRFGIALATAIALGAGLLTSVVAPRGPTTQLNALFVIAIALFVGWLGGALGRSRWALIALLVAQLTGIELGRLDVVGASLDVRLDNSYGVVAFILTRGLHGILVLAATALGMLVGIAFARRIGWSPGGIGRSRPIGTSVLAILVASLTLLMIWPASTPRVLGPDGNPVSGSIAELTSVRLGGVDQAVMIRAANPDNPVLLYLAGGPGQSDLALTRAQVSGWEQDFVYVGLDQRGNGKSYPAIDPVSAMTVDQAVADVIELTEYLRQRFDEEKIYLMGESWGTILGVLAVQQRPDLFYAWIPSGQMVDVLETDRRVYRDLTEYAERIGDTALLAELRVMGEPPYRDIPWANSNLLAWYEFLYKPYTPSDSYLRRGEASGLDPFGLLGSEYNFIEKANVLRGLIDTFTLIYPHLNEIDFRESVRRLEVPVYFLDGAAELEGRRAIALEWFDELEAPAKERITFENAAHSVAFEQADEVQRLLDETIVPATYGK
jgi:proline iminopeptidase